MVRLCNDPIGGPADLVALGQLTRAQLEALYLAPARGEYGEVLHTPITVGTPMSGERLFRYRCFLLGIRDPDTVAGLWAEQQKGG